jgi:sigma-54 dependent transcriptional regulator, acetoin dehydrogenase operon transcriptional activator AcoR
VGTTAPGVAARTGQALCVLGAEHFFDDVREMNCAAAPIRDIHGRVVGALDISSETVPFGFDAASVVGLFACAIENRVLLAQSREHLVVHFQVAASLIDSPFVGLVGVDSSGHVAWCNAAASKLLGLDLLNASGALSAEVTLGTKVSVIASLPSAGGSAMTLPNGLVVWARASMHASDGRRHLTVVSCPGDREVATTAHAKVVSSAAEENQELGPGAIPSLRNADCELIERTLTECGGNISRAAKHLGVSRGLIYRRLRGLLPRSSNSDHQAAATDT